MIPVTPSDKILITAKDEKGEVIAQQLVSKSEVEAKEKELLASNPAAKIVKSQRI
jgi:hypothetical protein